MYAAGGGDGYLTMAETALGAVQSAGLLDRFADVFSISNKKNKEIAFALHLENGEYTSGSYFSYFIWGSTQIKAEYRNAPDGVPVSSNQWFLYSDDFIGFLKRSKELGDQRTDVTYMERTGVSDMYEVIQWPNKLIGNISTGTMVWEQDFILYRYAQYYTMLAELRYHRKDYSGALTALNTLAQRAYGKANFYTDSSAAAVRQALVDENLKEFAEEGNVYFTLIRLGAIHDYNPYRYVDGLGQCGIDTSRPNQLLMPVSKKAMNKNNKITQTQGWS
ncbi:RagB/SusD family nutrient uptake outer membrane protein [Alistipes finegoldii]|uniref:RagB/SusD family nutrient uptake outer membrane protein n=2 Tax=Rikenellaceae TaxID=171550 RepID=UPI002732180E|nr:RagB/SusD family nutrient uptake outer membrane protein [Alistipes finegoldii]